MTTLAAIAFFAFASPLPSAQDYTFTRPNLTNAIAGVVFGPFARTEDVAFLWEAACERRAMAGALPPGSVDARLWATDLPLTIDEADAAGIDYHAVGVYEGATNALSRYVAASNYYPASGIDTWRMVPRTIELGPSYAGSWIDPSNDVTTLRPIFPLALNDDPVTNSFAPWRGWLAPTNIVLSGLAWRGNALDALRKLGRFRYLARPAQVYTNLQTVVRTDTEVARNVHVSDDGESVSLVDASDTRVYTNTAPTSYTLLQWRKSSAAYFYRRGYVDGSGNVVECEGSPLSWRETDTETYSYTPPLGEISMPVPYLPHLWDTGGVQRIEAASVAMCCYVSYSLERDEEWYDDPVIDGTNIVVRSVFTNLGVTVAATLDRLLAPDGRPVLRLSLPGNAIAQSVAAAAGVPLSPGDHTPPAPSGSGTPYPESGFMMRNRSWEELTVFLGNIHVILTVRPRTTIEEFLP